MDDQDQSPPEVTIEPADNGFIVRHHERSTKKDQPGRTIRRLAMTDDEALGHAKTALNGGRSKKKKSSRDGQLGTADSGAGDEGATPSTAPVAHGSRIRARAGRRRPVRSRRRV